MLRSAPLETIPNRVLASWPPPVQEGTLCLTDEETSDKRFLGACCYAPGCAPTEVAGLLFGFTRMLGSTSNGLLSRGTIGVWTTSPLTTKAQSKTTLLHST